MIESVPTCRHQIATDTWRERCAVAAAGHHAAAERLVRQHRWLSAWSAGLSGLVGTALLAMPRARYETWFVVAAGLLSVLAASLAMLAASAGLSERAETHRMAGRSYASIGAALEFLRASPSLDPLELSVLRDRMEGLESQAPNLPQSSDEQTTRFPDLGRWVA